jgi:hypothetical protein
LTTQDNGQLSVIESLFKKTNVLKTTLFIEFSTTMDKGEKKDQVMD